MINYDTLSNENKEKIFELQDRLSEKCVWLVYSMYFVKYHSEEAEYNDYKKRFDEKSFRLVYNNKYPRRAVFLRMPLSQDTTTEEVEEYKVTFNPNGGSVVESITVKKGEKITKPEDPKRTGYEFVSWKINEEDFDFQTEINENITLTATWKKEEAKYTSTIDKINLNENMTTSIDYENYTQPTGYYFITNLGDVFPSLAGKSRIELSWEDEDPASQGLDLRIDEWYAAFDKLQFDTAKENNAKTILNNIKNKTYKGVKFTPIVGSQFQNYSENHSVDYKYEYITVSKTPFTTLYNGMKSVRDGLDSEISSALSGSIKVVFPGYGVYGKYEAGLLSEKLCEEYNLVCDRW